MTYLEWLRAQPRINANWREEAEHRQVMYDSQDRLTKARAKQLAEDEGEDDEPPRMSPKGIAWGLLGATLVLGALWGLVWAWERTPAEYIGYGVAGAMVLGGLYYGWLWFRGRK